MTWIYSIKKEFENLKQVPSKSGQNFKDLHIHIMNIKGWLRGIHHHCSKERMQNYLDEYHFRYNRRSNMDTIFNLLLKRMVNYTVSSVSKPVPFYKPIFTQKPIFSAHHFYTSRSSFIRYKYLKKTY